MTSHASFDSMNSSWSLNGDSSLPPSRHRKKPPPTDKSFAATAAAAVNGNGKLDMRQDTPVNGEKVNGTNQREIDPSMTDAIGTKPTKNKSGPFFANGFPNLAGSEGPTEKPRLPQLTVEKFQDKDGEHLTTFKSVLSPDNEGVPQPHVERSDTLVSGKRPRNK